MEQVSGAVGVEPVVSPSASSLAPTGQVQADPQLQLLNDDADSVVTSGLRKATPEDWFADSGTARVHPRKRRCGKQSAPDGDVEMIEDSGGGHGAVPEPEPDDGRPQPPHSRPSSSPPRPRPRRQSPTPGMASSAELHGIGIAQGNECEGDVKMQDPVLPAPAAAAPPPSIETAAVLAPPADVTPTPPPPPPPEPITLKEGLDTAKLLQQVKAQEHAAATRIAALLQSSAAAATHTSTADAITSNPGKGGGAPPGGRAAAKARSQQAAVALMRAAAAQRSAAAAAAAANPNAKDKTTAPTTLQVDHHLVACQVFGLMGKFAARAAAQKLERGGGGSGNGGAYVAKGVVTGGDDNSDRQVTEQQAAVVNLAAGLPVPSQLPHVADATAEVPAVPAAVVVISDTARPPPQISPQASTASPEAVGPDSNIAAADGGAVPGGGALTLRGGGGGSVAAAKPASLPPPPVALCSPQTGMTAPASSAATPAPHPLQPGPAPAPPYVLLPVRCPGPACAASHPWPPTIAATPASCPSTTAYAHGGAAHAFAPPPWMPEGGCSGFFTTQMQLPTVTTAVATTASGAQMPGANAAMVNAQCYSLGVLPVTGTTTGTTLDASRCAPPGPGDAAAALDARTDSRHHPGCDGDSTNNVADTHTHNGTSAIKTAVAITAGTAVAEVVLEDCSIAAAFAAFAATCAAGAALTSVATDPHYNNGGGGDDDAPMPDCQQPLPDPAAMRFASEDFYPSKPNADSGPSPHAYFAMAESGVGADTHTRTDPEADADAFVRNAWSDCDDDALSGGIFASGGTAGVTGGGVTGGGGTGGGSGVEPGYLAQVPAHMLPPVDVSMLSRSDVYASGAALPAAPAGAGVADAPAAAQAAAGDDSALCRVTVLLKAPPREPQRKRPPQRDPPQQPPPKRCNAGCPKAAPEQRHVHEHLHEFMQGRWDGMPVEAGAMGIVLKGNDTHNRDVTTDGHGSMCMAKEVAGGPVHDAVWEAPLDALDCAWLFSLLNENDAAVE